MYGSNKIGTNMNIDLVVALAQPVAFVLIASIVIMFACNVFEQSASYLGRNMNGGARGALIDAIGSSLPELMVTLMFVASGRPELILAGIAVTAGSAIFNAVLIPALSIFAAKDENGNKVESFSIFRPSLIRDGFYLLVVEGVLIYFLGHHTFTLAMAGILLALYVVYAVHVISDSVRLGNDDSESYEYESLESNNVLQAIYRFDFNKLLFGDKPFTTPRAWVVLLLAVGVVGLACHLLADGIEGVSLAIGVPVYFSAVVLGAAATSVPDTILSIKSAKRGDYEDAVGNAIGSNIFDVTVALALPIALYLVFSSSVNGLPVEQSTELLHLRWFVFGTSAAVIAALVATANNVTKKTAWFLLSIYGVWVGFIAFPFIF